jgi:hypothetical protein
MKLKGYTTYCDIVMRGNNKEECEKTNGGNAEGFCISQVVFSYEILSFECKIRKLHTTFVSV